MKAMKTVAVFGLFSLSLAGSAQAQAPVPATQPPPPPSTKLEAFAPSSGSLLVKGYDTIGSAVYGVSVDAMERKTGRAGVSGLLVEIKELGTSRLEREGRAFVDSDEIPELLKGIDALLAITANPTQFKQFEVEYTTRGGLELVAFNNDKGEISYAVKAGKTLGATRFLKKEEMIKLKGLFESAVQKLTTVGSAAQ